MVAGFLVISQAKPSTTTVGRVAIGALAFALVAGCTTDSSSAPLPTTSRAAPTAPAAAFTGAQAKTIGDALSSPDESVVLGVLEPGLREAVRSSGGSALPPGSKVVVDADQARLDGDLVKVPATVAGGDLAGRWMLTAVRDGSSWLLISAVEAP